MRLIAACGLALVCVACAEAPEPAPAPTAPEPVNLTINPARIDRARDALPDGYEVTGYTGAPTPFATWGFREVPVSDPPQCAALGAPPTDPATARGWSASGPGGIVFAVVARAAPTPAPDPAIDAACARWTVTSGKTSGTVDTLAGPDIRAATTTGMRTSAVTTVEGGTETRSHADTFVAHLDDFVCFVAVVTDPGSPQPALAPAFASDLLTETVSTLRG